jgi:hypothetical protein
MNGNTYGGTIVAYEFMPTRKMSNPGISEVHTMVDIIPKGVMQRTSIMLRGKIPAKKLNANAHLHPNATSIENHCVDKKGNRGSTACITIKPEHTMNFLKHFRKEKLTTMNRKGYLQ